MARSTAFPRIRAEVIRLVGLIPPGRFTTYGSIATHMNCNPRHVAFVLARLDEREAAELPWHRVVAADARISRSMDPGLAARQNIVSARPAPRLLPIPDPPDGRNRHRKILAQSTIRGPRAQKVERRHRSLSCYEDGLSAKQ